ncbi:MAG: ATP-binding cassette domain-containing protein [Fibrobacterales bacterium]
MQKVLIEARNLKTWFPITGGVLGSVVNHVKAVDGVSLSIREGEVLSLVGESGSGKSTLGYTLLGLTQATSGEIYFEGTPIAIESMANWKPYRRDYQIIFQDSHSSLNPKQTIFEILSAPVLYHAIVASKDIRVYLIDVLKKVGLGSETLDKYPHAFSGGQRQRISIARTIALKPKLIICDEVVSALDVTIQAQILKLLMDLKREMHLSLLFISHDMAVVKEVSDRVAVMYFGKLVEEGSAESIFCRPKHEYTRALLSAVPTLDPKRRKSIATSL